MAYDAGSPNEPPEMTPDPDDAPADLHDWLARTFFGLPLVLVLYWSITSVWTAIKVGFGRALLVQGVE